MPLNVLHGATSKLYVGKIKFFEKSVIQCGQLGKQDSLSEKNTQKTEEWKMNSRENLPMMLSANDIQTMGFTRTMAYNILNRDDVPVVKIGNRKFIQRDKFFEWLDKRERSEK